jgi:GNAT superfamily N-acetyltransferase
MPDITLRDATTGDAAFALHLTEVCMRAYAEQSWGKWDGCPDFEPSEDVVVESDGRSIGLVGLSIDSAKSWVLERLYLLPAYQRHGIGSFLLRSLIEAAKSERAVVRLTVLEVNPARHFYERHGFVLTHTIPPRHHMEWCLP